MREEIFSSENNKKRDWQEEFAKTVDMSPKDLVEFLVCMEEKGELEQFLEEAVENDSMKAKLSYWEKWLEKDHQNLLEQVIEEKEKTYDGENFDSESLPLGLEKKFNREELELVLSNLAAIQLTFGCSKKCPFCGVDAVPGVKDQISYTELANLYRNYSTELCKTNPFLYWASEPSDYEDKSVEKTYQDVHQLASEYAGYNPGIVTRKTDEEWLNFIGAQENIRLSLDSLTDNKYEEVKMKADDIGIRIDYEEISRREHKKGIGMSYKGDKNENIRRMKPERTGGEKGIGCLDGILLTPRGLYNVVLLDEVGNKYPQGQIIVPLESIDVDKKVNLGDQIEPHLGSSVVQELSFVGVNIDPILLKDEYKYKYFRKVAEHKLRRGFNLLKSKDLGYRVWIDRKGVVQRVEQLGDSEIDDINNKKEEEKENRKYLKLVQENIKQLLGDAVASGNVNTEKIPKETEAVFLNELLERSLEIESKRKLHFSNSYYDSNSVYSFYSSLYMELSENNYLPISLDIKYNPKDKSIFVIAEDQDCGREADRITEQWLLENTDRIINDALKEGRIEFFTNFPDVQKNNIKNHLSGLKKDSLKDFELIVAKKNKSYFSAKYEIKEGNILDFLITIDSQSEKARIDCI
ncbi:MAG: hypothetical protein KAI67_03445 [Candidatus Pacebacteria bacterium]|nr:hypothetical protein [Candidatus Paceibacterota bacterium]